MPRHKVKLIFPTELTTEPVTYHLGKDFRVTTVVRRGDISDDHSWVILELEGNEEDIEKGLSWVAEKGIKVEPMEDVAP